MINSEKWNQVMSWVGMPLTVFIFLSWYTTLFSSNKIALVFMFILGVMITSNNMRQGILISAIGVIVFLFLRNYFIIPIQFSFLNRPFCWFNQQSGCAGGVATITVKLFIREYEKLKK